MRTRVAVIGVGHFMRCSVLAAALQQRGHHILFAMSATTPFVEERLRKCCFSFVHLHASATHFH